VRSPASAPIIPPASFVPGLLRADCGWETTFLCVNCLTEVETRASTQIEGIGRRG
jgi:hypothetical protein